MLASGSLIFRKWLRPFLCALALCLSAVAPASATPSPEEDRLIQGLIQRVENRREMVFLRNGEEHSAADAAKHMRQKYNHFKDDIVTAEDFIRRCATRSEMTKAAYKVKLKADGAVLNASDFMHEELKTLRHR